MKRAPMRRTGRRRGPFRVVHITRRFESAQQPFLRCGERFGAAYKYRLVAVGHDADSLPGGDIVSDFADGGACGSDVAPVTLYVEEPDLGFGKSFSIGPFRCCDDPAPDEITLDFCIVSGMLIKDRTVFRLKLRIETVCA